MHELNRQVFIKLGVIPLMMEALDNYSNDVSIVFEVSKLVRTLILDDDVRVPFGKAHDHAKLLVTEGGALKKLVYCMSIYSDNPAVMSDLCTSVARLAVRNEFARR